MQISNAFFPNKLQVKHAKKKAGGNKEEFKNYISLC